MNFFCFVPRITFTILSKPLYEVFRNMQQKNIFFICFQSNCVLLNVNLDFAQQQQQKQEQQKINFTFGLPTKKNHRRKKIDYIWALHSNYANCVTECTCFFSTLFSSNSDEGK